MSVPRQAGLPAGVEPARLDATSGPLAALSAGPADGRPVVVAVPGYTGSKEDFAPLLPLLAAAGYRSLAVDLRGQYQSAGPDDDDAYARDVLADDVAGLIADLAPAHVVGHSYGGIVCRAAVIAGARPLSLTLLGSGPAGLGGDRRVLIEAMRPMLDSGGVEAVWAASEAITAADPAMASAPNEVKAFLRDRFLATPTAALRRMGQDLLAEPDRTTELASCGIPILVAHGAGDDAWPPEVQAAMARRLGAGYVVIPDALHSPAVEAPAVTAAALLDFWRSVDQRISDAGQQAAGR